jgi:osmoprotectant transport system substrate-binding protein
VTVLAHAPAQDNNGFVMSRASAGRHHVRRLSDLRHLAPTLVLGGPPECAERSLCLLGLRDVYGLRFREFAPLPSGAVVADALRTGEIDVGMLDTTSGELADRTLVLLSDDRRLQPAENVVPVVNRSVVERLGPRFVRALDDVSARLSTAELVAMNRSVDVEGRPVHTVAVEWLRRNGLW